ncbi:acetyl coenzyme A synthetase (ADP forming), alpha domain [Pannonibacter phragmitetus]|uniref:Acetyl coenzyme A synthetase (ADP forming), alpha domain n=2 Tax=Pannonibacter phragmitetus TaxID=121719 RepID=A0A378ZX34_9HYPH|nr:CoA-binding protein [Pannonibacter phragmitetus]SUB01543.1 acetyl coenzyme A synthetase (ADP forming), alpha domain [Pannonibacter phragmitetus]
MTPAYPDSLIRQILEETKTIAIIGASANADRPVHHVMEFLIDQGFEVYPVNPGLAGKELLGRTVYASLTDIPVPVDMVDIFRASDAVPAIVTEALALASHPKVIWMQLGIEHPQAAAEAEAAGLTVIMNRCPKIEHPRLFPAGR